jgi:hypothetical protein
LFEKEKRERASLFDVETVAGVKEGERLPDSLSVCYSSSATSNDEV